MKFAAKLREARKRMGMTQAALAAELGVSSRTIINYEKGKVPPSRQTLERLASILNVSVDDLLYEKADAAPAGNRQSDINNATAGNQQDGYITEARERYGSQGAREMADLLTRNIAFFAGGDVDEAAKDEMFRALASAYFTCKERAREKFGRKPQNMGDR